MIIREKIMTRIVMKIIKKNKENLIILKKVFF